MRIAVVVAATALLGAGCAGRASDSSGGARPASSTTLEITVQPQGTGGSARTRTLLCPAGGSLPRARDACRRLARLRDPFAPVPKNVACTEIYGGPQMARVTGIFRGRRIVASFSRRNGCEIARWNRVAFLFRTA